MLRWGTTKNLRENYKFFHAATDSCLIVGSIKPDFLVCFSYKEVFFMTLGERIKEHRNRLGFSQEKIAELVNVSRQAVTKWEADKTIPCMENLITLADIFGISLSELSGNITKENQEVKNIREVKSTWRTYGKIMTLMGVLFFVIALILALIQLSVENSMVDGFLPILGINCAVWLILGVLFLLSSKWEKDKLQRLKKGGLCFDAEIKRVKRNNYGIRVGSIISGFAECSYINREGETCVVKSNSFILDEQNPDYTASVYVNSVNPKDYSVEINISETIRGQVDRYYR